MSEAKKKESEPRVRGQLLRAEMELAGEETQLWPLVSVVNAEGFQEGSQNSKVPKKGPLRWSSPAPSLHRGETEAGLPSSSALMFSQLGL